MCGRFVSSTPPGELARYFDAVPPDAVLEASYNVAPTNDVYAVTAAAGVRRLELFHWGLVPPWATDIKVGNRMINARAETLSTKNSFKPALRKRRCLIPLDGFYEWKTIVGAKTKQPMFIHRIDGEPLAVAGLWERWHDKAVPDGGDLHSTTIVTTAANPTMAPVHDRMPVILPPTLWDRWLDPEFEDLEQLTAMLVPAPVGLLTMHPVSTAVNNVRTKGPDLIEPAPPTEPAGEQTSLL